jgi:hypothetical protein
MKRVILFVFAACAMISVASAQTSPFYNPLAVDLARGLLKNVFETNATPFIQPMVNTINATSNARFYTNAYIPTHTDKPYVRVSANGMVGYITEAQRWYTPTLDFGPPVNIITELAKYGQITIGPDGPRYTIGNKYSDTLGLATMLVTELLRSSNDSGFIELPDSAATLFGSRPDNRVILPTTDEMLTVLRALPAFALLDSAGRASIEGLLTNVKFIGAITLPPGANMSTIVAAVPQIEIGALYGTELMIRYIPPVQFDRNVGAFSFWGVGLRHSLSQYFPERWFDLAVQGVYQGTWLENTVGFTESKLDANATIFSGNLHASKNLWDNLDIYTGIAYEYIDVNSSYTYVLPQEMQIELGLLPKPIVDGTPSIPTADQPGDQRPQTSSVRAHNTNIKWTIGATYSVGPLRLAVDYNVSYFNILTAGLAYTF